MDHSVSGVGVLDKSVSVLNALAAGPHSLQQLVDATGIARATAHRLAVALEDHGLVRRDPEGRFVLGVHLIALGRAAAEAIPLARVAAEPLEQLRSATGESVQLYVREGDERVCIAALESLHGLRTIVPMGASLPLGIGSAGRILSDEGLRGETSGTGSGPAWVESVGEREAGVASVSAPVRDGSREIVAAVSVSGPIERTTRQPGRRYGADVLAAARAIEQAAGLVT
jgi:DNA-binding IclR family transcriptional regulator